MRNTARRRLTPKERAVITAMRAEQKTVAEICAVTGRADTTVRNALVAAGFPPGPMPIQMERKKAQREEIYRRFDSGEMSTHIAKSMHLDATTVRVALQERWVSELRTPKTIPQPVTGNSEWIKPPTLAQLMAGR